MAKENEGRDETDGFARLSRTHRRILERLEELERAVAALRDPQQRQHALDTIVETNRFLDNAGRRHHDDEELSLFPRLAGIAALRGVIQALEREHEEHDAAQEALRAIVEVWDESGPSVREEQALPEIARRVAEIYRRHIEREERELFPAAREALGPAAAEEMGREMISRRRP